MFIANPLKSHTAAPRSHIAAALGRTGRREAEMFLSSCPAHRPTSLYALSALASELGVASLHVKDEAHRLGFGSFKALGGAYAVMRLVLARAQAELGRNLSPSELQSPLVCNVAAQMTVVCATDGNHGRSVAAGARIAGCRSVILVHGGVSETRAGAIAAYGAEVLRVAGTYDDSVVEAARMAKERGWTIVSDTSWDSYEDIPLTVMQGYTIMAGEAFDELAQPPTHLFLQAGVGGMAAAVAAYAQDVYGAEMPRIIVVEPERAACLFESARAGKLVAVPHGELTIMGMLECYEPSRLAWEVLAPLADDFVTLPEDAAPMAMRRLARPLAGDPAIVSGESGCAGLAGLAACLADPAACKALDLGRGSRVLVINSEGATDPALYNQLVGAMPEAVTA